MANLPPIPQPGNWRDLAEAENSSLERMPSLQSEIETIATSDKSYIQRLWDAAVWQTEEYLKKDFQYSFLGAAILGLLTVIDGSITATTAYWAVVGFVAVFVGRFGTHLLYAPAEIDGALRKRLAHAETSLNNLVEAK